MNYNDLTREGLENLIRERTDRLNQYYKHKGEYTTFAEEDVKQRLINIAGKGRGNTIGYGLRGKSKKGLIYQARELEYASRLFEEGDDFLEEKYEKMFSTFKSEHPDLTQDEWKDIVTAFGSVGKEIVQQFDSNQVADLYANSGKKVNLAQLMIDIVKDKKGTGATIREMTDELEVRLFEL